MTLQRLVVCVCVAALASAGAASAGQPTQFRVSLDDPELEAELTASVTSACGTAVTVDTGGFILVKLFDRKTGRGAVEMSVFHLTATFENVSTGATTSLLDVGPDRLTFDASGNPIVTIIGRSLTGSGVIGRVVVDATTGTVLSSSGRATGDWVENVCAQLT